MTRIIAKVACISITALLLSAQAQETDQLELLDQDVLVIEATEFGCYRFDVYFALTSAQQMRGLMFVREMPEFTGMLFVYRNRDIRSIWMKNTYISLDVLFIRADGTVDSIYRNAEPQSLASMPSSEPVNFVLELNAGVTERLHIDTNSRVRFDRVQN